MNREILNSSHHFEANTEQIRGEIRGFSGRLREHHKRTMDADLLAFVLGCDDARGKIEGLYEIDWFRTGRKKVMFQYIPSIGGGENSETLISALYGYLVSPRVVDVSETEVIVTQHGDTQEVNAAIAGGRINEPSCGLRKLLKKLKRGENPADVPHELKQIAKSANFSWDMRANAQHVFQRTASALGAHNYSRERIRVGLFDHNQKVLYSERESGGFWEFQIQECQTWPLSYQNPKVGVVKYGHKAVSIPNDVILPNILGKDNNDFSAAAVEMNSSQDLTTDGLRRALAEMWYMLHHRADRNSADFKNTQMLMIVADNDRYVDNARSVLGKPDVQRMIGEELGELGGVQIVNLESETAEVVPYS